MNLAAELLNGWGAALWRASWQGGLVALAVWTICRLVPSIPARFQVWLWRLVMLKFVLALLWSMPIELPLLPATQVPATQSVTWEANGPSLADPIAFSLDVAPAAIAPPASFSLPWFVLGLGLAWAAIVGWQVLRILVACRNAGRLRRGCRPCDSKRLLAQLTSLSNSLGLGRPPALLETGGQGSPMLIGILRPAIILPTTTLSRLSEEERALVLGHELAHLRKGDLLWSVFAAGVRAVFFFHPLVWLSERQLALSQEMAADELAIALQKQDPVSYATLLVSVVSKLGPGRIAPTMSLGAAGSHRSLKQRLSAMRFMKPERLRIALACGLLLAMVAGLGLVPWKVVAAQPREADKVPVADKALIADKAAPKETTVSGKLVSFKDGVLKIKVKVPDSKADETKEQEFKVADDTKTLSFIRDAAKEGTAREAFKLWEPGAMVAIKSKDGKITIIEIGVKKTATDKVPDKTPTKTPDRVPEKTPDKVPAKTPDKVPAKTPDKVPDRVPEKAPAKTPDKTPDRVPEKAPDKVPDRVPEKSPAKTPDRTPDKPAPKAAQAEKTERGRFVSFKDGTLTIQANSGAMLETKIPAGTKTLVWNDGEKLYNPADTAEALSQAKPGAWFLVQASNESVALRIGSRKGVTTGTFVSFKDNRLLMLGTSLGESFTKKYGNNVHFNKFRDDVPAFESVDGGEYKQIGTANKVLGNVKEGTIITVHGEGDDNITLVQIGVPKKN